MLGTVFTHKGELDQYYGNTHYCEIRIHHICVLVMTSNITGCWITKRYEVQQYALDYVFMWAT